MSNLLPVRVSDRVWETTNTTGTGTVTLVGAKTGYQAFTAKFSTGDVLSYTISDGTNWEVGFGTYTTSGTTLSRDTVTDSSSAGALVNFPSGVKDVWCDLSADIVTNAVAARTMLEYGLVGGF